MLFWRPSASRGDLSALDPARRNGKLLAGLVRAMAAP
jgi:hypothetical protein